MYLGFRRCRGSRLRVRKHSLNVDLIAIYNHRPVLVCGQQPVQLL